MHPLLHIDEIQRLIFASVDARGLAALARTCRAFLQAATDELWKTIYSISPLLSCLPLEFQYQYRKLQVEDLQRFEFYVPKIQHVIIESRAVTLSPPGLRPKRRSKAAKWTPQKSWDEFWEEIATLQPLSELWSNLRLLRVSNVDDRVLFPLIGMPGTNLTQLHLRSIQITRRESVVAKILDGIQQTPKLKSLSVKDNDAHLAALIKQSPIKYLRFEPRFVYNPQPEDKFPFHEILRKAAMVNLTVSLERDWYGPGIDGLNNRYLPALKVLWLDLTKFKPEDCSPSCLNVRAHSWTCKGDTRLYNRISHGKTNCGRRSPGTFLKGLDSPELRDLNIKFPLEVTGKMFLEVVAAVSNSCCLEDLTNLALAGEVWARTYWHSRSAPQTQPADLRAGLTMLLPLPQLKYLRLSVAPNFLDVLDLKLYRMITAGVPSLETLLLGHAEFRDEGEYRSRIFYERVPLHHLAAFCSMLPKIKDVSVGTVDGLTLETQPRKAWACVGVESLTIPHYADVTQGEVLRLLRLGVETYFPNSTLVKNNVLYRNIHSFRELPRF